METSTSNPYHGDLGARIVCKVCQKQFSKYTCPRCNLRYCSLACYKAHSLRCTESFIRENVLDEMREIHATPEVKQKTMDMLKRLHFHEAGRSILADESFATDETGEDDYDGSEGTMFSEKTVQRILEGAVPSLDELTDTERKHFIRHIAAGKVSHLIRPWNPWWLNPLAKSVSVTKQGTRLVQPLDTSPVEQSGQLEFSMNSEPESDLTDVPAPPSKPLPSVRKLTQKEPSPLLAVHLAEVIYAYCFTLRYYNGDWHSDPFEATSVFLSVSHVVGQAALPESVGEAFYGALQTVCSPLFKEAGGISLGVALFDDCVSVLRLGRTCIICALADLHSMLETAEREMDSELEPRERNERHSTLGLELSQAVESSSPRPGSGSQSLVWKRGRIGQRGIKKELKRISAALRKLFFLMCWANEQPDEVFMSIAALVEAEKVGTVETVGKASESGREGTNKLKAVEERRLLQEL